MKKKFSLEIAVATYNMAESSMDYGIAGKDAEYQRENTIFFGRLPVWIWPAREVAARCRFVAETHPRYGLAQTIIKRRNLPLGKGYYWSQILKILIDWEKKKI